jgi:uncharacterized SAM-binding protein YcdF (DUF218 family)
MHAARIFRRGYAPYLIPTGGKIPFVYDLPGSEAGNMFMMLTEMLGVDSSKILIEEKARNTHDHPSRVAAILKDHGLGKEIILVTSANHMPRSVAVFRKAGYTVYPAPTDFREDVRFQWGLYQVLPNHAGLEGSSTAFHEYYGLLTYKLLGWI